MTHTPGERHISVSVWVAQTVVDGFLKKNTQNWVDWQEGMNYGGVGVGIIVIKI